MLIYQYSCCYIIYFYILKYFFNSHLVILLRINLFSRKLWLKSFIIKQTLYLFIFYLIVNFDHYFLHKWILKERFVKTFQFFLNVFLSENFDFSRIIEMITLLSKSLEDSKIYSSNDEAFQNRKRFLKWFVNIIMRTLKTTSSKKNLSQIVSSDFTFHNQVSWILEYCL